MSHETTFKYSHGPRTIAPGGQVVLTAIPPDDDKEYLYEWKVESGELDCTKDSSNRREVRWSVPTVPSFYKAWLNVRHGKRGQVVASTEFDIEVTPGAIPEVALKNMESGLVTLGKTFNVRHEPSVGDETANQVLWVSIRNRTRAIGFANFSDFVDRVLCQGESPGETPCLPKETSHGMQAALRRSPRAFHGVDAYEQLKAAAEIFLLLQCGVRVDERLHDSEEEALRLKNWADVGIATTQAKLVSYLGSGRLPYIERILNTVFQDQQFINSPFCHGILTAAADCPCLLELIWSYWHEEGGLVQTLNAISLRFQNRRGRAIKNPLNQLEIAPLRPLNNLLWGYIQDERSRLTISRRASEYQSHYGITLVGEAVRRFKPVDNRSKFLEAFHTLLYRAWTYYQEVANTHIVPDGFPLLNSLREVHMLLAEGAYNQFGDLPWTARVEMLVQQWLMARPEMQDFLRAAAMVPYKEAWMGSVDTMKKLQGWTDVPVTYFRDLGVYGEQILLSVRYDDWIDDSRNEDNAKNWADYWKQEVQGYIHAYRAATGVDLTNSGSARDRIDAEMPALHLQKRQRRQDRTMA
ncbi:MAG: hypothetical protein ACK5PS_08840 [Desulfopila sp.]